MNAPLIPPDLKDKAASSETKAAEDLRVGDVFYFHDELYVCLMQFTDFRRVTTIVSAIAQKDSMHPLQKVTGFRLLRTFQLPIVHHIPITLDVLGNTDDEVNACPNPVKSDTAPESRNETGGYSETSG